MTVAFSFWQAANLWLLDRAENLGADDLIRYSLQLIESYRAILSPRTEGAKVPESASPVAGPRTSARG